MALLRQTLAVWRNVTHRARVERDLDDELRAMFESLVDDRVRAGLSPDEARRAAAIAFGSMERIKDRVRDVRTGATLDLFGRDMRYAARLLRRSPLFTIIAALSLAVGTGATTTIFTVGNGLLFRAPPGVRDPDALVDIFRAEDGVALGNFSASYPYFLDVREQAASIAGVFAFEMEPRPITVGGADETELALANLVSPNYFAELGVRSAAGRLLTSEDETDAVVLSHRYWRRRFNGDPSAVGATIRINRRPFTVVGVADPTFHGANLLSPDVWLPMSAADAVQAGSRRLTSRAVLDLGMGGRLKPSVTRAMAAAELDRIARQIEREHLSDERGIRLRVARLSSIPGALAPIATGLVLLLLAIVSTVLLIACANVSGVLLAGAAVRRREMAVRMAIGAGRRRLIQQLLTETLLLCALGGVAGLALARAMTSLLLAALPAFPVPIDISLPLDGRVVAFAVAVSCVAAALSGTAPALHASRTDVTSALKDESQGPSDRLRLRSAFVIAQVACSCMLVAIAALLVRGLRQIAVSPDFDPHGVEIVTIDLASAGYTTAAGDTFARDLVDRLRAQPAIDAATLAQWMPGRGGSDVAVTVPGVPPPAGEPSFVGTTNAIEPDFFRALRARLLAGRDFTARDAVDAEPVVIVSETTARYLWPDQDAVGRYVTWHEPRPGSADVVTAFKVIGVAPDLKSPFGPRRRRPQRNAPVIDGQPPAMAPVLMLYVPMRQRFASRFTILARARNEPSIAPEIRRVVKAMDINLPMLAPQPLDAGMGPVYLQIRVAASVAAAVGLVGLLLAAMGVYGVAAFTTQSRTREIGVRLALGARRGDIVRMVLRQAMVLVSAGSTIGLAMALAGGRLVSARLVGVAVFDAATFSMVAALFVVVGLAACCLPAWHATRIDAMEALRYE